ncbi:MAG TPA: hypothetical protein PLV72_01080 [Candidatus Magasanikbacteria bacterium]|nr:hypothetical protein [Candidatus Magasanikbacteria bacterium]
MSIFGGACEKYSQDRKQISTEYLRRHLIVRSHIPNLKESECEAVCTEILGARDLKGEISMRRVCEILGHLKTGTHEIGGEDKRRIMERMEKYFAEGV